jgi:8-oxo-dGTP diphosphatase
MGETPKFVRRREFPELPMVGVGGVVIDQGRALLVRRATEPALGEWTIPGGLLEVGETLTEGVEREIREETGLIVRTLDLIEALERIFSDSGEISGAAGVARARPRYHYIILDYLCEPVSGELTPNAEISDLAFVREDELEAYQLTPVALRVLHRAFAMARGRAGK